MPIKAKTEAGNPITVQSVETSGNESDNARPNNFKITEKPSQTLRCSLFRMRFPVKSEFNAHRGTAYKGKNKVKCPICDWELPMTKRLWIT